MNRSLLLEVALAPLLLARAAKKARPTKAKKPAPKPAKKPVKVEPPRPPIPAPLPKPKPVTSLPFENRGSAGVPTTVPQPIYPVNGERTATVTPRFGWISVSLASQYQVMWGAEANLSKSQSIVVKQTAATLPPEQALAAGETYYWRVRAGNDSGWGPWSPIQEFVTPEEQSGS